MKNKIGIIESGFMSNYIEDFIKLCSQNSIEVHLFTFFANSNYKDLASKTFRLYCENKPKDFTTKKDVEDEIKNLVNIDDYDYFLTDCMGLSFTCNIFHNISLTQRMAITPNYFYRKLLQFGHKKQIEHESSYYRKCPKIFVVSNYLKKDYAKNCRINPENIIVAYPGTNSSPDTDLPIQTLPDTFTFGAVTCGFTTKGGYTVLEALRMLKKKHPDQKIRARIINPNHKKQKLLQMYLKLHRLNKYVDFLPFQKDINKFYKTLDCLVCASRYEAFGRVVTEAMLCKTPAVTGSNVGAADIVKDGENGFVFDNENKHAKNLALKLEAIMLKKFNKENFSGLTENALLTAQQLSWKNFAGSIFYGLYPQYSQRYKTQHF